MGLIILKCSSCGDNMHADDSKQMAFCMSCGAKNIITQDVVHNTYNTTHNTTQHITKNIFGKDDDGVDELVRKGYRFIELKDFDNANAMIEKAIKKEPSDYRVWVAKAALLVRTDAPENDIKGNLERAYKVATTPEQKYEIEKHCFIINEGVLLKYITLEQEMLRIEIPDTVTRINYHAFSSCTLSEIKIPSSVVYIGDYAFWACYGVSELTIPDSVTFVGSNAFDYWGKYHKIMVNKKQSKRWDKNWDKNCRAKIIYR